MFPQVCCGQPMCGVQYRLTPCDYDGVSEWRCETCGQRRGRWSGKLLHEGELEARYGVNSPYMIHKGTPERAYAGGEVGRVPGSAPDQFGEDLED